MKAQAALQIAFLALLSVPAGAASPPLPRGTEIHVNTSANALAYKPSVTVFPDGGFVVAWATTGAKIRARFLDSQGRLTGGEISLAGATGLIDQVVADADGSFLLVWTGSSATSPSSKVYVRRFNRNGTPRGQAIRANAPSAFNRQKAVAAIGQDGRFAIAWRADIAGPDGQVTHTDAVGRVFTALGTPVTPELTLLEGDAASAAGDDRLDAFPSSVALPLDGTLTAIVQQLQPGCLQRELLKVPVTGGPSHLQFLGSPLCAGPNYLGLSASLTMGIDGSLIATWEDSEIQAQRLAPDGRPRREWFRVSQDVVDYQLEPAVALQAGGSFVIVWTEETRDGDGRGIFGRAFASNGTPLSADFPVNVTTAGDQFNPAIAAPRHGPIVVVWAQENGRGDIFARVLSAN